MNSKAIKSFFVFVICFAAVAFAQGQSNKKKPLVGEKLSISEVKEYRKMFRVNETPIDMTEATKFSCAIRPEQFSPHYNPGIVYYINDVAKEAIKTYPDKKVFPVGSIIVKEKQEQRTENSVEMITVMKKISSSQTEDSWEYKMYETKKWTEVKQQKKEDDPFRKTCIECHRAYKDNDYISGRGIKLLLQK